MAENKNRIRIPIFTLSAIICIILYYFIPDLPTWINGILITLIILCFIGSGVYTFISFLYISAYPTDLAVKMRLKKYTGKILEGGWSLWLPFLDDFIIFDSRIKTMWIGFIGTRGHQKIQIKEFDHFKEKFLIVDRKRYYSQIEQDFTPSDFYSFGPLFTSNREEVNILCSINYRIKDALKLAKTLDILGDSEEEKIKFKTPLVSKLVSALKETIARMTLDEIFEERQKLMELLVRTLADLKDDWGLEVLSVSIEEMWLEDEKLQEMLDEKKKAEIIADAKQIMEKHDAEIKIIIAKAEQDRETLISKARDECNFVQEQTRQDIAKLRRELMELRAQSDKIMVETQSKSRTIMANAEAQRLKLMNQVVNEKSIQYELINTIPAIMDQISLSSEKFVLVPSTNFPLFPRYMGGGSGTPVSSSEGEE